MRTTRNLFLALLAVILMAAPLAACGNDRDDGFRCPQPITSPVDHKLYTPWVENPHETDGCPYPAAAFAMPYERPVQSPGMSATDFLLLMMLFDHHERYGPSFYDRDDYYRYRVGPAWDRYPGTYSAGPGGRVTTHHTTINNYGDAGRRFSTTYASDIKTKSAEQQTFVDRKGKPYQGGQVPQQSFSGGKNSKATAPVPAPAPTQVRKPDTDATVQKAPANPAPKPKLRTRSRSRGSK